MSSKRGFVAVVVFAIFCSALPAYAADVTITVDAASPIRTIPMTLYGANLASWDWHMDGTHPEYTNLLKASGCKYLRVPGGSWGNGVLWSDIEGPNGSQGWKVSYAEYLYLMTLISQPGEEVPPTLQPIVNFPGWWYDKCQDNNPADDVCDWAQAHGNAVNAAVGWVQDQTARPVCAQYWEIGNEIGGPWEVGYFPEISGTYYGDYLADFSLGMKAVNPNIKIGAVAEPVHKLQEWGWYQGYWTYDTLVASAAKNAIPDFLIIHSYPGSGSGASYNPTLLGSNINDIAQWTSNLDGIVQNAIGSQYVGQIEYCMTEWNPGGTDTYNRHSAYISAMFRAQYILEMAKHKWTVSNPWISDYNDSFRVYPVWYINPLLINYFGRDMVQVSSSNSLVRAYATEDTDGNLTVFIVNNSPTATLTADISIAGFLAGSSGQRWLIEPAGSIISGGINIQDKGDISINGVVHPDPFTASSSLPPQSVSTGNNFTATLPASCMLLLKIPAGTGDTTPPAAPTGLTAGLDGLNVVLDWDDNNEADLQGYNVYRSTTSGSGYTKLNFMAVVVDSNYIDDTAAGNETYYYVVTAVDTSWNQSGNSNEASVTTPVTALGTVLYERWTGISGTAVSNLTSNAAYPNSPSFTDYLTTLEGPTNLMDNYGTRIRGYLYPPTTGNYTFWIAGDDHCELRLSTNGTPANAALIANVPDWTNSRQWNKFSSQQSSPVALTAGQKYYIEVLHKEGGGGDNIAVAWSGPGISQQVIDGQYLSPWLKGLYGDFNGSETVDIDDLSVFVQLWLADSCVLTSAIDLDGDCHVDFYEFSQFAQNWMN